MSPSLPSTPSPCIGICWLDPESGWCAGCQRTTDEIRDWTILDDERRRDVIRACEERRRTEEV